VSQQIQLDMSHARLMGGRRCEDAIWRQIVTVLDAAGRGYDLFDIEEPRRDYSPEEFANLLMCEFIDGSASAFPVTMLQPCHLDSWVE